MKNTSATNSGSLFIVATPIGNLEDISARALKTLKEVDFILAEDTRHTLHLLRALGIKKPLIALHEHNEIVKSTEIINSLKMGKNIALVSDAGTPLICDPGFFLVRLARQQSINITPIAGPCALIAALSAAGLPSDSFTFLGFLPAKSTVRLEKLRKIKAADHTQIVYESTHRILDCIDDVISIYGAEYHFVLAKEISKTFEHFLSTSAAEIRDWLVADKTHQKGEFVLIFPAFPLEKAEDNKDDDLLTTLLNELPLKQAVKIAARLSSTSKNELYKRALLLENNDSLNSVRE